MIEDRQISRIKPRVISAEERIRKLRNTIENIQDDPAFTNSNYLSKLKKELEELENK